MPVFLLTNEPVFPPADSAREDGLLAVGGDVAPDRVESAYRQGIFPWYGEGDPVLWWSPNPRLVLYPEEFRISRRLRRDVRSERFKITADTAFGAVIHACGATRVEKGEGTWIVEEMMNAYIGLHRRGIAHSIEAWDAEGLAGGLYGVSLGKVFFGESMFARKPNASKVALVHLMAFLTERAFALVDCQVTTDHLLRFGAREIFRGQFLAELRHALKAPTLKGPWTDMFNGSERRPATPAEFHDHGKDANDGEGLPVL